MDGLGGGPRSHFMTPVVSNQPFNPFQRWKKIDPRSGDDIIEADIDAKTTGHEEVICTFLKLIGDATPLDHPKTWLVIFLVVDDE